MPDADAKLPPPKSAVEFFRAKTTRQQIHPIEHFLVWVVALQLVWLPWALGGMRVWSQLVSAGFSVVAIAVALLPRNYSDVSKGQAPFRLYTWPKLLRFPIFWIGLAFLAYGIVGALNPAWSYMSDSRGWWMTPIVHIEWLPASVRVPFSQWGPWRMVLIHSSVWLTVCAAWIGFTRRKSLQVLFSILAANAFLLAGFGIAVRVLGGNKMFWVWNPGYGATPVASFVYKNHAGAYFNLLLALCAGMAFWHYDRAARRLDKSSPAGVFAFFGTAAAMIVFFSYSRAATILMFVFLVATFTIFVRRMFFKVEPGQRNALMIVILLLTFSAFASIGFMALRTDRFVSSMETMGGQIGTLNYRTIMTPATLEMARAKWLTGWGAGSFQFLFPIYQQKYPALWTSPSDGKRMVWEHAHNDYAELLAEYGGIGMTILALGMAFLLWRLLKLYAWENPLALLVLLGCSVTLFHCLIDFHFYNPAILTTWCVLFVSMVRWVELEELSIGAAGLPLT